MDVLQKFVNDRNAMLEQAVAGFVKCYRDQVGFTDCPRALRYLGAPQAGRVGVVSGGGWGHDPAFIGYLGKNLLDAVAIGDTFTPPARDAYLAAIRAANGGSGVVCLYGNYPGDIASVNKAVRIAAREGIEVRCVIANDDVASADPASRRGQTGESLMWKVGGAAAACGYALEDVARVAQKAVDRMRSIGVGLASCIIPETGRPNYLIESGTMEIGVSHHGLFSKDTCKLRTADETADIMLEEVLRDMPLSAGDQVAVMVSGLGNTMSCELNILFGRVYDRLSSAGVEVARSYVGNFFTSLDMMGATLTVMVLDAELIRLLDHPARPVALSPFSRYE